MTKPMPLFVAAFFNERFYGELIYQSALQVTFNNDSEASKMTHQYLVGLGVSMREVKMFFDHYEICCPACSHDLLNGGKKFAHRIYPDMTQRLNALLLGGEFNGLKEELDRGIREFTARLDKETPVLQLSKFAEKFMLDYNLIIEKYGSFDIVPSNIQEELLELKDSLSIGDKDQIKSELGDLLFSCVNLSRHLDLDAEESLRFATKKFERRFETMENNAALSGRSVKDLSMSDYDILWEKAKSSGL